MCWVRMRLAQCHGTREKIAIGRVDLGMNQNGNANQMGLIICIWYFSINSLMGQVLGYISGFIEWVLWYKYGIWLRF